jgi:hypothetical protein
MSESRQHLTKSPADFPVAKPLCAAPDPYRVGATVAVLVLDRPSTKVPAGAARSPGVTLATRIQTLKWAGARIGFYAYIGFSMATVVGGFVTAPLMTWFFFNDWRFWRYWRRARRLFPHAWHIVWQMLKREGRFMFSVPLTSPPQQEPDHRLVELSPAWQHGSSCGSCQRCCEVLSLRCPVLDETTGFCTGYNSFYWRYFNCGRYPTRTTEINYYGCGKWRMKVIPIEVCTERR